MGTWKFPIDPIRFTDAEMERKKAEYQAEHGYEIAFPGITEIITLWNPTEPEQPEFDLWKQRNKAEYLLDRYPASASVPQWQEEKLIAMAPHRYNEISQIVDRKRSRYRRMLASPTPTWMTNVASVLTWFDDINDLLGTAGVIFRTASWLLPKVAKRFFLGPAGWLFLAADIFGVLLSLTSQLMAAPFHCMQFKRHIEGVRNANPFSQEARQSRARKLKRFRPSMGEAIEALQTTDQVFGRGLCLGPILGAAYDVGFGIYKAATGQRVSVRSPLPRLRAYEKLAYKSSRELAALGLGADEFSEEDHFRIIMAAYVCQCVIRATVLEWNPLDEVEGLEYVTIPAEGPKHPTTRFVLEEAGINPGEREGWPFLDKEYVTYEEIWDAYREPLETATMDYFIRNRYNQTGLVAAQNAREAGMMAESNIEGTNPLELVNTPAFEALHGFSRDGCPCKIIAGIGTRGYEISLNNTYALGPITIRYGCAQSVGLPYFELVDLGGNVRRIPSDTL